MYAKINNGVVEIYPYTIGDLRKDNPNTSFPKQIPDSVLEEFGIVAIQQVQPPTVSHTQTWQETTPVLDGGVWKQAYSVSNASQADIAARIEEKSKEVRKDRDTRLSDTDWTQVADAPVDKAAWATYRQALRDVPEQAGFPYDITWPSKPE